MPNIIIPLNSGLDNFSEPEEAGSKMSTALENVWIDTPGKCTIRPYTKTLTEITGKTIHKIKMWANPDLPYDGFGWIVVATDPVYNSENGENNDSKSIWVANRDFSDWIFVTFINSGKTPNKIELFEGVALFTLGKTEESLRYSYFNTSFFDGVYTYQNWFLDTGRPVNNFIQIKSVSEDTSGGTLAKDKNYFYKIVPIFDGLQIAQLPQSYAYQSATVDTAKMEVVCEVDDNNFNPRCTSFDVYRAEGTDELEDLRTYYKIKSISTYKPIVNSGGISDISQLGKQIADNGTFRNSSTSAPYTKDDFFAMINNTFVGTDGGGGAMKFDRDVAQTGRSFVQVVRLIPHADQQEYYDDGYGTGYGIWVGDRYWDSGTDNRYPTDGGTIWSNLFAKKDAMFGMTSYLADSYAHNDVSVTTDLATDVLNLRGKLRNSIHYSVGDKAWLLVSKTNLIRGGSGLLSGGWEEGMHDGMVAEAGKPEATNFHHYYRRYQVNNVGYDAYPCLLFSNRGQVDEYNGKIIHGNNGFSQKVAVEVGKTYFFQYAFNWSASSSSMSSSWNHSLHVKLTRYAGGWDNGSSDWYAQNSTNAIHYKSYNQSHRRNGVGRIEDSYGDYVFDSGAVDNTGWWVYNTTFVALATEDIYLHFGLDNRGSSYWNYGFNARWSTGSWYGTGQNLMISDIIIAECDTRTNYYGGNKTVIPASFTNYDPDTASAKIQTNDYNGGNVVIGNSKLSIVQNTNTVFELSDPVPSNLLGQSPDLFLTKSVTTQSTTGTDGNPKTEITFTDLGYTSLSKHPTGKTPINVKYEFSQYIEGRLFVADCRYTNEQYDEVEQDKNLILFSELNQPNIIPVTNYIKVQDNQGGDIIGLGELMGNLVVFMENSIWRLNVPNLDPNQWSLVEATSDLGCTSSTSIYSYEDGIFFANKEGLWIMSKTFTPQELSRPWRQHYQENYDANTIIHYCPKSKMLYVNQNNTREVMVLDLNTPNTYNWLKLRDGGNASSIEGWTGFMNDETSKPFFFENRDSNTYVGELEARSGNFKMNFVKRTGWIRLGDLKERKMIRRINIRYKNNFTGTGVAPDLYIWIDGKGFSQEDIFYQKDGDSIFLDKTGKESIASIRCGVRCKYFALEIGKSFAQTPDKYSDNEDIFELLSLEVEWEN